MINYLFNVEPRPAGAAASRSGFYLQEVSPGFCNWHLVARLVRIINTPDEASLIHAKYRFQGIPNIGFYIFRQAGILFLQFEDSGDVIVQPEFNIFQPLCV